MNPSFIEAIKQHLLSKEPEIRNYIGASTIGNPCERKIWYDYKGIKKLNNYPYQKYVTFQIGRYLEQMILDFIEQLDVMLIRPSEANNYLYVYDEDIPNFCGHMDGIIVFPDGIQVCLEIKTSKSSSFGHCKKDRLKKWNKTYYSQIQAYMGMAELEKTLFLMIDKDSSELYEEWVFRDRMMYQELKYKAIRIMACDHEPEKINKSPLFYLCKMCDYKERCHETS